MKRILILLITSVSLFLLVGCPGISYTPYYPNGDTSDDPQTEVKTIQWVPDANGFTQFYTNDPAYVGTSGWTFYKWGDVIDNPMGYVETQVNKVSGDKYTGYGILYCLSDANNFFMLVIDTDGNYKIGKVTGGAYASVTNWTVSEYLTKGYDKVNTLKVQYNGNNTFGIYFNDHTADEVTDDTDPKFTGGKYGYICAVSKNENFPTIPMDVRFKQINP
jgi:hypothetical protein